MGRELGRRNAGTRALWQRGIVFMGVAGLLGAGMVPGSAQVPEEDKAPKTSTSLAYLEDLQDAFSKVADEVEPAVVTVLSTKVAESDRGERRFNPFGRSPRRATGTGTGVIIRKE